MAVGKLQRQRMPTGCQLNHGFRLALAEMQMRGVLGHGFTPGDKTAVNNQMMVARAVNRFPCRTDLHAFNPHDHLHIPACRGAVSRLDDIYMRRMILMRTSNRNRCQHASDHHDLSHS